MRQLYESQVLCTIFIAREEMEDGALHSSSASFHELEDLQQLELFLACTVSYAYALYRSVYLKYLLILLSIVLQVQ